MERKIIKYLFFPILIFITPIYYLFFNIFKFVKTKKQKKFKDLKIICVGNPDLGGSGKTTLVKKIVEDLKSLNKKVAVVTRGYKKKKKKQVLLLHPKELYDDTTIFYSGDEAYMLFSDLKIPVCVSNDRVKAIEYLKEKFDLEIIISDDGYQNFSFYKDINILIINMFKFQKKNFLFPLIELRETLKSSLKRADYVILNHVNFVFDKIVEKFKQKVKKINNEIKIITSYYKIINFINLYNGKSFYLKEFLDFNNEVILCCGIGEPKIFQNMLNIEGFKIKHKIFYPDHYWYDLKDVLKWYNLGNFPIIVTKKDAVKLKNFLNKFDDIYFDKIFYPEINFEIKEGKDLWQQMINSL
ncbi:MAG: tetraacyldisaccharide 4'-kinase [Endomicrobiia bacterium]